MKYYRWTESEIEKLRCDIIPYGRTLAASAMKASSLHISFFPRRIRLTKEIKDQLKSHIIPKGWTYMQATGALCRLGGSGFKIWKNKGKK